MRPSHLERLSVSIPNLSTVCPELTRAEADAQDLFYVWATKSHQLRKRSKVKAWLFTTLHRAFLVGRLGNNRFPHCEMEEGQLPPASLPANHLDSAHALTALSKVGGV